MKRIRSICSRNPLTVVASSWLKLEKLAILLLFCTNASAGDGRIVLSEVMFDPLGSEYYDEYVEIFNASDTDSVDLGGWTIGDSLEGDLIVDAGWGKVLGPGQFGLILDPGYFEASSTYDPLPEDALILTIDDASFGKSGWNNRVPEPVILIDAEGDTVAVYTYSVDNPPGHSDEKIILAGGDDPSNWANSLAEGGTPGRENSVCGRKLPGSAVLSVQPNPFNQQTVISYQLPVGAAWVNLYIYDTQGRLVRRLKHAEQSSGKGQETWDGKDEHGMRLKMGIYIVYLEALNEPEGVVYSVKKAVVLARRLD